MIQRFLRGRQQRGWAVHVPKLHPIKSEAKFIFFSDWENNRIHKQHYSGLADNPPPKWPVSVSELEKQSEDLSTEKGELCLLSDVNAALLVKHYSLTCIHSVSLSKWAQNTLCHVFAWSCQINMVAGPAFVQTRLECVSHVGNIFLRDVVFTFQFYIFSFTDSWGFSVCFLSVWDDR